MPEITPRVGNLNLEVTLRDRHQPRPTPGVYRTHVRHRLWDDDKNEAVDASVPLPEVSQSYEIQAVQFVLDPAFVHSCYPAPGAVGRFTHVLPHVTLNRDVLPWERELKEIETRRVQLRAPWLAILVFAAEELPDDPAGAGLTTERSVRELLTPTRGVQIPAIDSGQLTDEVLDSACQTLDVPGALFGHLVPRETELHYLAHVREVAEPRTRSRSGGEVLAEGEFAVVYANRLPRREGSYAVHLVSLEGFQKRLDPGTVPDDDVVRLCALHSWSFTYDQKGTLDVEGLLRNLVAPSLDDPENLALRLGPATTTAAIPASATERLNLGYVPVSHRLPTGHLTFAWYRGPGIPLTAQALPADLPPGPHTTADHRLIYDEAQGIFDVSYAAAWALGRTIGLANPDYTAQLTRVRRELACRATRLAALATDPQRRDQDPDGVAGTRAFAELAEGFGATVLQALRAPRATVSRQHRTAHFALGRESLRALLTEPRRQDLLRATVARHAGDMPDWLSRLALLHGVPSSYLIPDPRMLPWESLRLFRIDPGWITALIDGARDVGTHTSLDVALHPVLRSGLPEVTLPRAGLLISSELVQAWPDFDVTATVTGRSTPLPELRRDRLAPTVLLVLYDQVPDELFIREPGQGIHFGLNSDGRINLRQLDKDSTPELGAPLGRDFPDPSTGRTIVDDHLRPAGDPNQPADVLDLRGSRAFVPALAEALGRKDLRPSELALELITAPYQQCLVPNTAGSAS